MTPSPGTRLGPYEITAQIGMGGMGEVYRATDTKLDRDVAIKVLPQSLAGDPDRIARFQREAKTLAALNHPNIAAIYGLEDADGSKALVMELVEGPTLADRIAQGAIPVDEALPIARQIAEALEAAHEQGIIHRDLKPANIKLRPDGVVKVLDFGLAKALEPTGSDVLTSQSPTITTPAMTQAGMILGTAAYMSPEQARGKPVDKRADIWAFGCVLYEMLTAKRAFENEDVSMTLSKVLQRDPNFDVLPAEIPAHVRQTLRVCLRKPLKERVPDIGAVQLALEGAFDTVVRQAQGSSTPARRLREQFAWMGAGGILVGAILGLAALLFLQGAPTETSLANVYRATVAVPADLSLRGDLGSDQILAVSPDGQRVAFIAWAPDGQRQLWVRQLGGLSPQSLAGTENARSPFWSPDSRFIGFFADRQLKRIDAAGGPVVILTEIDRNGAGGTWNEDDVIVFSDGGSLHWIPASGGVPSLIVAAGPDEPTNLYQFPFFLPDGVHFVHRGPGLQSFVRSLESNEAILLGGGGNSQYALAARG